MNEAICWVCNQSFVSWYKLACHILSFSEGEHTKSFGLADQYLETFYANRFEKPEPKVKPKLNKEQLVGQIEEQSYRLRKKELSLANTNKERSPVVYERRELNVKLAALRLNKLKDMLEGL